VLVLPRESALLASCAARWYFDFVKGILMSGKKGLLVIGTQRSGSNLFRLMLNQLPDVVALHPPHILQTFMPLLSQYGPLTVKANFAALVEDVCRFVELNPASWENIKLDRASITANCTRPSLIEIYRCVQETAAEVHGKAIWCCKSMANLAYIPQIEAEGVIKPFYIYLYRDGRDVALSFKKAIVGEKHMFHLARQWSSDQELCLAHTARYAPERTLHVRYEELLENPERVMRQICEKIGARFTPEVLQYHKSEEAQNIAQAGSMWANVVKPIMTNNSNKFLSEMSAAELAMFESVAGATLTELGYELHSNAGARGTSYSAEQIAAFEKDNAHLKQEFRAKLPPEELAKRRGQEDLVSEIKSRLGQGGGMRSSQAANG